MIVISRFKEMMNDDQYPSIHSLISKNENEDKAKILNYLKAGKITSVSPSACYDVISGDKIKLPLQMMTDGKYAWRSDVIYYVEKYNMSLLNDFIKHVLS